MNDLVKEPAIAILNNRWQKVYWFARMLINTDKYASVGKDNKLLSTISASLRIISESSKTESSTKILELQKLALKALLETKSVNAKTKIDRINRLVEDLDKEIVTLDDMAVFILTCENVMQPINQAIENIPNDDKEFTESFSKSFLDIEGIKGLASLINLWDDLGVKGCLTVERTEIVKAFATLRVLLSKMKEIKSNDSDIVLTAFVQEFERRAAQKRKSRAGSSLEDVTSFILNYYKIPVTNKPEHFQADMEVDKWVKTKDGWLIGISCKRTLRERWKQVSSADSNLLSKFKIKYVYHILTFDEDLSDEKLTLLGGQRHLFYLPDDSRVLSYAKNHVGLKTYVRPISDLIKDIEIEIS